MNPVSIPSKIIIQNPILIAKPGSQKEGKVRGMKKIWSFLSENFPFSGIGLVLFQMSLVNIIVLREDETLMCIGIHGQFIHINVSNQTVIVKLSSQPEPADTDLFLEAGLAFDALSHQI